MTQLSRNTAQEIQMLFAEIKKDYKQLKECEHQPIQLLIIDSLTPKCNEVLDALQDRVERSDIAMKRKHIKDIKQKADEKRKEIVKHEREQTDIGKGGRIFVLQEKISQKTKEEQPNINNTTKQTKYTVMQQQNEKKKIASIRVIKTIAMQQIKSVNLKIEDHELKQMLKRMQNNAQVTKFVETLLNQQGNNVDKVEQKIKSVYQDAQGVNVQLDSAEDQQIKHINGIRKVFHKTATGFWGIVSWPFKLIFRRKS